MTTLSDPTSIAPNALQGSPLQPLLEISDLSIDVAHNHQTTRIVDRISLTIPRGKTVALLGESGSGKSLTAMSILRLLPYPTVRIASGSIRYTDITKAEPPVQAGVTHRVARSSSSLAVANDNHESLDLTTLPDHQLRHIRGRRIAMIFQEPMTALNPVYPVGQQIVDVLQAHNKMSNRDAWKTAIDWLKQVGLPAPDRRVREYPHQLSGGMRQRVLIAMALCCYPKLLIADEPTTALDATVQMQILDLLRDLQRRHGMSILFITHDLGVVAEMADHAYVMYAGRIVESAPTRDLLTNPLHPYTQGLLRCVPQLTTQTASLTPNFQGDADQRMSTIGTTHEAALKVQSKSAQGNALGTPAPHTSVALIGRREEFASDDDPNCPPCAGLTQPEPRASARADAPPSEPRAQATGSSSPLAKGGPEGGLPTTLTHVMPDPPPRSGCISGSILLPTIPGTVPEPSRYPTGCRFHTRCQLTYELTQRGDRDSVPIENAAIPRALRRCVEEQPLLSSSSIPSGEGKQPSGNLSASVPNLLQRSGGFSAIGSNHFVACWETKLQ